MFNFSNWVKKGIIDGYKQGITPFFKVTELTANYLLKGLFTEAQAEEIAAACPAPLIEEQAEDGDAK